MRHTLIATSLLFLSVSSAYAASEGYSRNNFPVSRTVTVPFAYSSSEFQPGPTASALLEASIHASMITICGRTSNHYPSRADEMIALSRAVAARDYLIELGVSPLKIMINYASAMDYIADNTTDEGMSQNQRVDIQLFYVPL